MSFAKNRKEKHLCIPSTRKPYRERSSETTLDPLRSLSTHKQFQMSLSSFLQERKEKKSTGKDVEEESGKDRKKKEALTVVPWASILMAVPFGATAEPSVS